VGGRGGLEFVAVEDSGSKDSTSVRISDNELLEGLEDLGILMKLEMSMGAILSRFESVEGLR